MAFPIDVGSAAINLETYDSALYTTIDLNNPANLSGLITSVDVWAYTNITGFRVGIFYLVSGSTYKCRSSASIGNVTAGSKQTFPVSLPIQKGDFIGYYFATGTIECGTTVGVGRAQKSGEYIDPGDSANYGITASRRYSLWGNGIVKGWCSK